MQNRTIRVPGTTIFAGPTMEHPIVLRRLPILDHQSVAEVPATVRLEKGRSFERPCV